jgi:outer membrane protein assembly factor BamB
VWQRDLGDMITRYGWGEASSPVIHDGWLVVNWDHEGDSFLVVLDAATGETRWCVDRDEVTSWSTPLVIEHGRRTQLITAATRRITSYDFATGEIIWECGGLTTNVIPSPVRHETTVLCMSGFKGSAAYAISLDTHGDVTGTDKIAWQVNRGTPYVPSPLLYGKLLYFTRSNQAILTCLNAETGEALAGRVRLPSLRTLYASPVGAADRIYFTGRNGTVLVIKNRPKLEVLAVNKLDARIDATPALVGREMFLRSNDHLYCIAEE